MTQITLLKDFRISTLGHLTAPACLGLAERTFGKESPEYKAVQNFTKDKRAGFVASVRGFVVGFVVYDNRQRDKAEVLAFAVHRPDRRQGIGRLLMSKVAKGPRAEVAIKVDDGLLDAHLFLRSQGFRAVEIERGKHTKYVFTKTTDCTVAVKQDVLNPKTLQHRGVRHENVH